jgi:antitoxin CptB
MDRADRLDPSLDPSLNPKLDPSIAAEVSRLRWQCRRGMLELDLLLNRFLDAGFVELDPAGRTDFVRFLGYQDQIIHDWLMGRAVPADAPLRRLVVRIQQAMRA